MRLWPARIEDATPLAYSPLHRTLAFSVCLEPNDFSSWISHLHSVRTASCSGRISFFFLLHQRSRFRSGVAEWISTGLVSVDCLLVLFFCIIVGLWSPSLGTGRR